MSPKLLLVPFAILALAACDQSPDPAPSAQVDTPAPAAPAQSSEVEENLNSALSNLQQATDSLGAAAQAALGAAEGPLAEARSAFEAMSGDVQQAVGSQISALVVDLEERRDEAMTDAQKAEAVANARARAESIAQGVGLSPQEITEAANATEEAARRVLDYDGPLPVVE